MTFDQIVTAIRARLAAEWSGAPVAYQNETYEPDPAGPWVYLEVLGAGGETTPFGSTGKRVATDRGTIFAHVFVPVGTGTADASRLASEIGEVFRSVRFNGISTEGPSIGGGESADDSGLWYRVSASIPFAVHYTA